FTRRNAIDAGEHVEAGLASMEPPSSLGGMFATACVVFPEDRLQWSRRVHSAECADRGAVCVEEHGASMEPPSSLGGMARVREWTARRLDASMEPPSSLGGMPRRWCLFDMNSRRFNGAAEFTRRNGRF